MPPPPQPAPPSGYTLVGYEVSTVGVGYLKPGSAGGSVREMFAGTADGLRRAWDHYLSIPAADRRLSAVAWWVDGSLDECPPGRERFASEFQPGVPVAAGQWAQWKAVEAVGELSVEKPRGGWRRPKHTTGGK